MTCDKQVMSEPKWMRRVLVAAGVYNLAWGAAVVLFPSALFRLAGMELPRYPQIWQCVGMIVGVYGVGYLVAATDPLRHWPITLVGLLGKILGPIGFVGALVRGDMPLAFVATIITNDLIWWLPFGAILYNAFKHSCDRSGTIQVNLQEAIQQATSQHGVTLAELSSQNPTLTVFLRHIGCTFCREAVSDLAKRRSDLEARGINLALVHMSETAQATRFFERYGLESVHHFSDPTCKLYRAFGLDRGTFLQLFGPRVWFRGITAGLFSRHGMGPLSGDGFQMPGVFLVDRGKILSAFRAATAADRPDYLSVACRIA
jgi:peroxiredoxin